MAEVDIASHYGLPSEYPEEWPAELDEEEGTDEDSLHGERGAGGSRSHKSRYFALERSGSHRTLGSQKGGGGGAGGAASRDTLAQKDEPDPLGSGDSVLKILKKRGLSVDEESRVRNRFLLSSTSFSPALFLSQAHSNDSIQTLMDGLGSLSRSIDQKSASLKVLVEANFERFVRAKATIDSVYTEMRQQGAPQDDVPLAQIRRKSGHIRSRSSMSRGGSPVPPTMAVEENKKNALTKESEYGMKGIRGPLVEASVKAEEVWGPALGGREREQMLKSVVDSMERHRDVYEIGSQLCRAIKQRDYDSVFELYTKARTLANSARNISYMASNDRRSLTDDEAHTILTMGRMWLDVDQQIQVFKRDLWRRLSEAPTTSTTVTASGPVEEHMELIGALLELGVEENPIWVWLLSRYHFLKTKIASFCERCKTEIEILRRRLASGESPSPQEIASYLRLAPREGSSTTATAATAATATATSMSTTGGASEVQAMLDTDQVVELWECVHTFLNRLLSPQGGILGEVLDFWEVAQTFIDGSKQRYLPTGFEGESRQHHKLRPDDTQALENGIVELINLIRESVLALFAAPPPDDISLLATPISPPSPSSPGVTPTGSRFKLDPKNMPHLTPKRGEIWEDFAFWPPFSNSLSGAFYLSKFLVIIGTAAGEMAALGPVANGDNTYDLLKSLVSVTRERSIRVVCAAWNKDAEICKMLEDWTRDPEQRDLTKMPGLFVAFENAILSGMQKILYVSEAMSRPGTVEVVTQPPTKLLQMVRSQFVSSVYKALSGLVENAEHPSMPEEDNEWVLVGPVASVNNPDVASTVFAADTVDAQNRNVRLLLTLSNIKALQALLVPQLVANFETSFSVKLTDEAKTIRDVLVQIETRLFQSYTKPTVDALAREIHDGITAPNWVPATNRPQQVRPYVYNTLLTLVLVHTEISTTIPSCSVAHSSRSSSTPNPALSSTLMNTVLTFLLARVSSSLLAAFGARPSYSLAALMQATLDTEFIAQTLSQYSTDEASTVQSQIYVELDRRTTHEARAKLQSELGEMRGVLKKLRERTKGEFACFRKSRTNTGLKSA